MAISVAVAVGDTVADALVERLAPRVRALKVGPGDAPGMDMGPLITAPHRERVRGYVDLGVEEGAELVVDGRAAVIPGREQGYFLGGCLFDRVQPGMRIYQEEIFGPVLSIMRVESCERAAEPVNSHAYGKRTAAVTRSGEPARASAEGAAGRLG